MKRMLLLNGFMATGKSTVGEILSRRTGLPFVDLDQRVEARAGKSISEIFAEGGEARFRELERAALESALDAGDAGIVALGGGALLGRSQRLKALSRAVVVTLESDVPTLLERTRGNDLRPLLRDRSALEIEELLASRAIAYAEAHARVDVRERSPEQVADAVLEVWQRDPVAVAAGLSSYRVDVGAGFAPLGVKELAKGRSSVVVITDRTVAGLYGDRYGSVLDATGVRHSRFELVPGEEHKTPASLERIWEHCLGADADRRSLIIGLGGGVATDVAGFAAATWMRGVPWVSIPTTLLGMVDASVGGKTAVDLPGAKNCIGAFWQPSRVLCDVDHLYSEPERGFRGALAEVVKTALIGDPEMFEVLERRSADVLARDRALVSELVRRCIAVKARVVSEDERETGFRAALNLGHTVGHALEACGGFGVLSHGEAVSLGLVAAMRLGERLGRTPSVLSRRVRDLLAALQLPVELSRQPLDRAAKLLSHDKKRGGDRVRFVFCSNPGSIQFERLALNELQDMVVTLA